MTEKITYRGWTECYRISNNEVNIIINASAGGRIMVYERNGVNPIYEDPKQDGILLQDFEEKSFDPDGGRFDYGQEKVTSKKHNLTYMGKWHGEILDDHSVKLTSQPDSSLGILSIRIFELDSETSRLAITQTMKNISSKSLEYFFWGRTLVKVGGKLMMPLNPDSNIPGKWGRYIWGEQEKFENDPADPGVEIIENIFSLIPSEAGNAKYGTDARDGWMAYGYKGLLFFKKYNFYEDQPYTELYDQTNIFYTNKTLFAEMEPISPTAVLEPGEEYSYTENWYLIEYPPASDNRFDVIEAARVIGEYKYPEK